MSVEPMARTVKPSKPKSDQIPGKQATMPATPKHDGETGACPPRQFCYVDIDRAETHDWVASLEGVLQQYGGERAQFLLSRMIEHLFMKGIPMPFSANTPHINTIPRALQPPYPGDRALERRIKSLVRWNAMAMVVRANRACDGIGGHISTYASAATLYEVGFNHFFRGKNE
ncbi:MAG TPA: hypothetical protein P5572_22215, partial [Phycisphaerae bacterium]|nr:hypothetical protein [Phycisphaerae bacterium]